MADDSSVKNFLLKFVTDTSDFKRQVQEFRDQLNSFDEEDKTRSAEAHKDQQAAISAQKEQLKLYQDVKGEASALQAIERLKTQELKNQQSEAKKTSDAKKALDNESVASAKRVSSEQQKNKVAQEAWLREQSALNKKYDAEQEVQRKRITDQIKSQWVERTRLENAEHKEKMLHLKEEEEARKKAAEQQAEFQAQQRERSERGGFRLFRGKAVEGAASGIFGGGAKGMLGTALLGGGEIGIAVAGAEMLKDTIEQIIDKFKDLLVESGKLTQLNDTFEKLAHGKGIQDTLAFMGSLRAATHNLASDIDILQTSTAFLQSNLKISPDDMLKMTKNVVDLARARGHTAQEALQAEQQFFLTGRAQTLSRVIGVQRQEMMDRGYGPMVSQQQRMQEQFNLAQKVIQQHANTLGVVPITFTESLQSVSTIKGRLEEAFGQGITKSSGFQDFIKGLVTIAGKLSTTEDAFNRFGKTVGDILGRISLFIGPLIDLGKSGFEYLSSALKVFAEPAKELANLILPSLGKAINPVADAFAKAHPIVDAFAKTIVLLSGALKQAASGMDLLGTTIHGVTALSTGKINVQQFTSMMTGAVKGYVTSTVNRPAEMQGALEQIEVEGGLSAQRSAINDKITQLKAQKEKISKAGFERQAKELGQQRYNIELTSVQNQYGTLGMSAYEQTKHRLGSAQFNKQYTLASDGRWVPADKRKDYEQSLVSVQAYKNIREDETGSTSPIADPELARRIMEQRDQAEIELRKKKADEAFEDAKAKIENETELNERMYKLGTEQAREYYSTKKKLADETYAAAVHHAIDEFEAQKQSFLNQAKEERMDPTAIKVHIQALEHDRERQITQAGSTRSKAYSQADLGELTDEQQIRIKTADAILQHTKDTLAQETSDTEYAFKQQTLSAEQYTKTRINLLLQQMEAEKQHTDTVTANLSGDPKALLTQLDAYQERLQQLLKQLYTLKQNTPQVILGDIQKTFSNQQGLLQSRLSLAQSGSAGESLLGQEPTAILAQMQESMVQQIAQLTALRNTMAPYTDDWYKVNDSIFRATQQLMQFNEQAKSLANLQPMFGSMLDTLGQQLRGLFGSYFARGIESAFTGVGRQLEEAPQLTETLRGGKAALDPATAAKIKPAVDASNAVGNAFKQTSDVFALGNQKIQSAIDFLVAQLQALATKIGSLTGGSGQPALGQTESGAAGVQSAAIEGGPLSPQALGNNNDIESSTITVPGQFNKKGFSGVTSTFTDSFKDLTTKTIALTQAFGSFFNTIQQSGSAMGGAFSGTVGGAGLATSIASSDKNLGSGAIAGIGAAGAAAGLIIGLISGHKQEEVQDDIQKLNVAAKSFQDAFSSGNASLSQTIKNLQGLIAEAQIDMANTKKGSSQFKQLILQYQEEITQLQDQAAQTMTQLHEQLDVLSSPTPYQSMISSIEQVVQQYAQFAGAAQNTQELAQANQFLTGSLQQLAEGYSEQLLQDEQTAVQNALNLNNLLNQRNQLQYQYLQQTEQIMGQGTLTRNQTLAQSKYSQMYQASVNHYNQLMDLNEQIAVSQAQVDAAQQVFQLAHTRQGLESQMVALQTASINLDMARIAAMKNLLDTLSSTGYSITNLSGLSTSNPNQLILAILTALLSQLGVGSGSSNSMSNLINTLQGIMNGSVNGGPISANGALTNLSASAYASLSRMGLGGYNGVNLR